METTQVPIDGRIDYSAMQKNEIQPFATTWIDLQGIMLSEISQSEKDHTVHSHLYVESKKAEFIEAESIMVVARENGEMWVKGYRFLPIRKISSGDLIYNIVTTMNNNVLYYIHEST